MTTQRFLLALALTAMTGVALLAARDVFAIGPVGPERTMSALAIERVAYAYLHLDGIEGVRVLLTGGYTVPLMINHFQVINTYQPRGVSAVKAVWYQASTLCHDQEIPIGADGDVLKALENSGDSPCAGTVDAGGPLGSQHVLVGPASLSIEFTSPGINGDQAMVGALSPPGRSLIVQGFDWS